MKSKYSEIFPYSEFLERYLIQYEEFLFFYKGKEINISYGPGDLALLAYGTKKSGYLCKDYNSPQQFLQDPIFDGKKLEEIWDELE